VQTGNSCKSKVRLEDKMIEIGRLCVKICGRDAGKKSVVIDILDGHYVLIDGETRRRKCNIMHLEPLKEKVDIKKNASHDEVKNILKEIGITARDTKAKQKSENPPKAKETKKEKPADKKTLKKPKKDK
jgi:large subunit ribosomal protein L14e